MSRITKFTEIKELNSGLYCFKIISGAELDDSPFFLVVKESFLWFTLCPCLNMWRFTFFRHVKDYQTWILLFLLFVDMLLNKSIYWKGRWHCLGGNNIYSGQTSHMDTGIMEYYRGYSQILHFIVLMRLLILVTDNTHNRKFSEVFSNNSQVYYCISCCSLCPCLHKWFLT